MYGWLIATHWAETAIMGQGREDSRDGEWNYLGNAWVMKGFGMMARKGAIALSLLVLVLASVATNMTFARWLDAQRAIRGVRAEIVSFDCHLDDPQRFTVTVLVVNRSEELFVLQHLFSRLYHENSLIATLNFTHQEKTFAPDVEETLVFDYVTRLKPDQLPPLSACRQPAQWTVDMWLTVEHAGYRGSFQFPARARYGQ